MTENQPVQTDTTTDSFVPPGAEPIEQGDLADYSVADQAVLQMSKLADFLVENFPDEVALTNVQQPERPADTAIRLLLSLSAKAPREVLRVCSEPYCNRIEGHEGEHGWVN